MTYTAQSRDRFRLAVAAVTGVTAVAALSATGWVAGAAAQDAQAVQQQEAAVAQAKYRAELKAWRQAKADNAEPAPRQRPQVELRARPHRTEVTWRYVQGTGSSAAVGTGGQVATVPAQSGGQPAAPQPHAPAPAPAPAPPPPPPAPAPSSGS